MTDPLISRDLCFTLLFLGPSGGPTWLIFCVGLAVETWFLGA